MTRKLIRVRVRVRVTILDDFPTFLRDFPTPG